MYMEPIMPLTLKQRNAEQQSLLSREHVFYTPELLADPRTLHPCLMHDDVTEEEEVVLPRRSIQSHSVVLLVLFTLFLLLCLLVVILLTSSSPL